MNDIKWNWMQHTLVASAAIIILIVLLVTQPWGRIVQADSLVESYSDIGEVQSGRMIMSGTPGGEPDEQLLEIWWITPDRFQGTIDAETTWEFIEISGSLYLGGDNPADPINESQEFSLGRQWLYLLNKSGAASFFSSMASVKQLPDEDIDGIACRHYTGIIDTSREIDRTIEELTSIGEAYPEIYTEELITSIMQEIDRSRSVKIIAEFWIDKRYDLFRQIQMESVDTGQRGEEAPAGEAGMQGISAVYSDINEKFVIEVPETPEGELLPGWTKY